MAETGARRARRTYRSKIGLKDVMTRIKKRAKEKKRGRRKKKKRKEKKKRRKEKERKKKKAMISKFNLDSQRTSEMSSCPE